MKVLDGTIGSWQPLPGRSAATIGVLDGVHLGHRTLLATLDPDLVSTVLTFDPHPVEVLRPGSDPRLITTVDERLHLLEGLGVSQVGVLDLSEIRELEPDEFVESVLVDQFAVGQVVVGVDFRFGHDRKGDIATLRMLGRAHGFEVAARDLVAVDGEVVSSSGIRRLITAGRVAEAGELLGSRFRLSNTVVRGDNRGVELGFPTANLRPPERKVIPATGVYACFAGVDGITQPAAVNVGVRPTFGGGELLIEAHLLDFDRQVYGEEMTVEFVQRLRPELAFDTTEDLVLRMGDDVAESRAILEAVAPSI